MKKAMPPKTDVLDNIEVWCTKHQKWLITGIMCTFTLFSLLLFNLRVSEGGDDSTYIIRAVKFINNGTYPSFQGPLYPLFLSVFVALFGIKLSILKASSFAVMLLSVWMFYKFFRKRISYTLLFAMLLLTSVSSYYIYFTSQTYSEALFIFLQLPIFALVYAVYEDNKEGLNWPRMVLLSAFILAGFLTRTVGIGALLAVITFFIFVKRYKEAAVVAGGFMVLLVLSLALKSAIWQIGWFDGGQASTLLYKHPYQLDKGRETFGGFVMRFIDNSNLYLSKHFLKMVALRPDGINKINGSLTLLLYGIFAFSAFKAYKKDKYFAFIIIYLGIMLSITFVVLQKLWDQYRLIVPFFPYMILVMLYGLNHLGRSLRSKWPRYLFMTLVGLAILNSAYRSFTKADLLTLRKNMKGDLYEGYSDDWRNYLSMAEYASKALPDDCLAAARKPNMAQVYGNGRRFYGIYRYDTEDPDKLLARLKENNVTHVIMASLRKNPVINNGLTINTVQRYLYIIAKKYPQIFKLEHQIGGKVEPAYLFRVDYKAVHAINSTLPKANNIKE